MFVCIVDSNSNVGEEILRIFNHFIHRYMKIQNVQKYKTKGRQLKMEEFFKTRILFKKAMLFLFELPWVSLYSHFSDAHASGGSGLDQGERRGSCLGWILQVWRKPFLELINLLDLIF